MEKSKLYQLVGAIAYCSLENNLLVAVEVMDIKMAYGNERCLIRPLYGKGEIWVNRGRLLGIPENLTNLLEKAFDMEAENTVKDCEL